MQRSSFSNPLLDKALRLLVHPLILLSLALLLINDHILRRMWPSAVTGKLGDFAWLFFIPLAVIAVLALLAPAGGPLRGRAIPAVAYGSVGLLFGLAKTAPAGHALTVSLASKLLGFPVGWRLDPTDLVALGSLAASAWLWRKTPEPQPRRQGVSAAGWVALVAAALLTIANSPAPDPGIYCLDARPGELDAYAGYATYRSTDGGLTWASLPNQARSACPNPWSESAGTVVIAVDPHNALRQYRTTPGQNIELSEDGGATWRVVYEVPAVSEASAAARRRRLSSYAMMRPVPLDGKVDRVTGNAVFAMGHAGVLVEEAASGAWREAAVGQYRPVDANSLSDFLELLLGEILLAVGIGLLGFDTLATRLLVRGKALWVVALVVAWLIWAAVVFLFPPALAYGYGAIVTYGAMLVLGVVLLVLTVIALAGYLRNADGRVKDFLGRPLLAAVVAAILFLLPYALWATGTLPRYPLAAIFGAILGVAAIIAGARWTRSGRDISV
ncbi:MAG: hypothetical protein ACM30E_10200 [Nitrososphaerales archaeon]